MALRERDVIRAQRSVPLLQGGVKSVRVRGKGWCTPLQLSCSSLDVAVGSTKIDVGALVTKQAILLQQPARGSAEISFTARDWDQFLVHPLMTEAIARREARLARAARRGGKVAAHSSIPLDRTT